MDKAITIVTAFFDIGRGNWTNDKGYSPHLHRTSETYLDYFSNLAKLENDMIIFTSSQFEERIEDLRQGKPTTVVIIDLDNKFKFIRKKISSIQNDEGFIKKLSKKQIKNPEYWSPNYVLVCNLKTYFISKAIELNLVKTDLVAWIDFGYCRSINTLNGINNWQFPFNKNKINFFTIKKGLEVKTINSVFNKMINNDVFIIGGVIVASKNKWLEFIKLVFLCQKLTLKNKIVDDDQGIFVMCYHKKPELMKLNFLGKNKWFSVFKKFNMYSFWGVCNVIRSKFSTKM
ncbi:protein YibB [Pectobacterium cacticida]|uniref:protein YibB n=1 Tax=Pectobacterium cacticida TaxID=69221 RepID=UPI002FEEA7F7